MRIRFEKLAYEPFQWQETVSIPTASLDRSEVLGLGRIDWRGRIWAEAPGFRLSAAIGYEQTIACDRCLGPVAQRVDSELELVVVQNPPVPTDEEIELSADDLEIVFVDGDEIDLDALLLEQLQLNVPMRTICRDDCRGLCPECGTNWNDESCDCEQVATDPRWEALRDLRGDH